MLFATVQDVAPVSLTPATAVLDATICWRLYEAAVDGVPPTLIRANKLAPVLAKPEKTIR